MPWHSPETDVILESMPRKQKRKKLIYSVAENDAEFCIGCIMDGKIIRHGAYAAWINMLQRCYGESYRSARTGSLTQFLVPASGFTLTTEADRGLPRVTRTGNVVALSGAISGGAVSSVAATLPAWAKPQASQTYIVYSRDSSTEGTCRVTLRTDRSVVVGSDYKTTATELNITFCV